MLNNEALPDVFVHGVSVKTSTAVWMVTEPIMQLFGWLTAGYGFCVLPFLQELKDENCICWGNSGVGLIQIWYCMWILLLNYLKCVWIYLQCYSWVRNVYVYMSSDVALEWHVFSRIARNMFRHRELRVRQDWHHFLTITNLQYSVNHKISY